MPSSSSGGSGGSQPGNSDENQQQQNTVWHLTNFLPPIFYPTDMIALETSATFFVKLRVSENEFSIEQKVISTKLLIILLIQLFNILLVA